MINPKKFMIPTIIATGYFSVIVVPGPILGVIIGMGIFGLRVAKGMETAKEEEADTVRCDMLGLDYEVPGSRPEDQDELSCESCFEKKAEIFQVTGNYCLRYWQQETHPDL
jgi:hypothetical protein